MQHVAAGGAAVVALDAAAAGLQAEALRRQHLAEARAVPAAGIGKQHFGSGERVPLDHGAKPLRLAALVQQVAADDQVETAQAG